MQAYKEALRTVFTDGRWRHTSVQGQPTKVYPGLTMRFDLSQSFPLLTLRSLKGSWKALRAELLWFLSGSTNIADLHKFGVHLWDSWATPEICARYNLPPGELGRIYGAQWRAWRVAETEILDQIQRAYNNDSPADAFKSMGRILASRGDSRTIDQIGHLVHEIINYPDSKRMMVTSWNPEDVEKVFIAPCHGIFKCIVAEGRVDLVMFQRSADMPVGVPFNIASYALLLMMLAQVTGLKAGEFVHCVVDAHIYKDQMDAVEEILSREPQAPPTVTLNSAISNIFDFKVEDIVLNDYNPLPKMNIPVAV